MNEVLYKKRVNKLIKQYYGKHFILHAANCCCVIKLDVRIKEAFKIVIEMAGRQDAVKDGLLFRYS